MRVLITGACGLLGAHVAAFLSARHEVLGVDRNPWWGDRPLRLLQRDLLEPAASEQAVREWQPEWVIHCAALADVDLCERDPQRAHQYNVEMTRRLARAVGTKARLVYISTDGLFHGDRSFATEDWAPSPRTVYGRSKWQAEQEVAQATANHLIIRTNFFGWSSGRKKTSGEWLYRALRDEEEIILFEDFYFTPIYVVDFVQRLGALLMGGHRGLFHLCGRDRVSKAEFGLAMADLVGFSVKGVRRGSIEAASLLANRPRDMSLDSSRFSRQTGLSVPGYRDGLRRFLSDRKKGLSARLEASPGGPSGRVEEVAYERKGDHA